MTESDFALECVFSGFDLGAFDEWLSGLPDAGPKHGFTLIRGMAKDARENGDKNTFKALINALYAAWQADARLDILMPKAKAEITRSRAIKDAKANKDLERWLDRNINQDMTCRELYAERPDWVTIGFDHFRKQFTAANKRAKKT